MEQLADRLEQAADTLTTMDERMPVHAVAASAFGAHDPGGGLPGRLGRELHEHWTAVLDARSREAAGAAARLADTARSVRETLRHYGDTDDLVRRRLTREM
jgi:uncharacterized protein (DUF1501 family)